MGILRNKRNASKSDANTQKIPRIEIELLNLVGRANDVESTLTTAQSLLNAVLDVIDTSTSFVAGKIWTNPKSIVAETVIPADKNAMTVGPITIDEGVTLTVEVGAVLIIL